MRVEHASLHAFCTRSARALVREGHDIAEIAGVMRISEERAGYLLEISKSRGGLKQLRLQDVPTEGLRILLAAAQGKQQPAASS